MLKVSEVDLFHGAVQAAWGVTLEARAGEITGIIGANGAGKTTILHAISGLLKPRGGSIRFEGQDLGHLTPDKIVRLGISQVPENRQLFPYIGVLETLEMGAAFVRSNKQEARKTLAEVLELFPVLGRRARQQVGTLSGGEQQMVAIGRALMARPKLLMLDEPSLGLAPLVVQEVFKIIQEINSMGVTVLLVEQNTQRTLRLADRAYVLEVGRIVNEDTGQRLLNDPHVKEAYLGI